MPNNYLKKLKDIIIRDEAKILQINNINIDKIGDVYREYKCVFICNCGDKYSKTVRQIINKTGLFCKKCTIDKGKDKSKNTCLKKYGKEHYLQTEESKNKAKEASLKKYGVDHPMKNGEYRDKISKKSKETCLEKYGVEYPIQNKKVYEKVIQTNLERYGTKCSLQNKKVQNKTEKTNIERYGVKNPSQNNEIKEKVKQTNIGKYGVECSLHNKKVRETIKQNCIAEYGVDHHLKNSNIKDKIKQTCLNKYGVEYPIQSNVVKEKKKKTCFIKYNVSHPMQVKEIFNKVQDKYSTKTFIFKTGEEILCQGYEPRTLKFLEEHSGYTHSDYIKWDDNIFWYYHHDIKRRYYPDIPFLKNNLIIEVKSNYTFYKELYKNLKKADAVLKENINFEFWVYDHKNLEINIDTMMLKNKFNLMEEIIKF